MLQCLCYPWGLDFLYIHVQLNCYSIGMFLLWSKTRSCEMSTMWTCISDMSYMWYGYSYCSCIAWQTDMKWVIFQPVPPADLYNEDTNEIFSSGMHRTKGINLYFIMLMGIMHSRSMYFQNVPFFNTPKVVSILWNF